MIHIENLKKRQDFLRVSQRNLRKGTIGLVLMVGEEQQLIGDRIRVGITASRKVGKAVKRNRAKRRLRALSRKVLKEQGIKNRDHVLIARTSTLTRPFEALKRDLGYALGCLKKQVQRERES